MKHRQWLCKFIVLMLLITGMCFEGGKADSIFVCQTITGIAFDADSLKDSESIILSDTVVLQSKSSSTLKQAAHPVISGKRELKLSMVFLCVAVLLLLQYQSYAAIDAALGVKWVCRSAVVIYIHNKDGKKRA